jgi:hypothetical protein
LLALDGALEFAAGGVMAFGLDQGISQVIARPPFAIQVAQRHIAIWSA